ncbi:MAG: cation transporter [Bacteroidetes bacterium]|nr:cation transporter [Bacteroidota bacterium]
MTIDTNNLIKSENRHRYFKIAFGLAVFTILYNMAEGLASVYFGYEDETLALFGFGVDSFVEVISGFGIAHMIRRIQNNPEISQDKFEQTALRVTGFAFYLLVFGLIVTSFYNFLMKHTPETTLWGVIISLISIAVMWILVYWKRKLGRQLNSAAILADAECTQVCIYMSVVLLVSSGVYELTRFAYMDIIGTLGLAYLSFKEGLECFEKAEGKKHCSCEIGH